MLGLKQEKFIISGIILIIIAGKCCSLLPYSLPDSAPCQVVAKIVDYCIHTLLGPLRVSNGDFGTFAFILSSSKYFI